MSERITEAELLDVERACSDPSGAAERLLARYVAEVRRLRELIVDHVPEYEFNVYALGVEARAIRKEASGVIPGSSQTRASGVEQDE